MRPGCGPTFGVQLYTYPTIDVFPVSLVLWIIATMPIVERSHVSRSTLIPRALNLKQPCRIPTVGRAHCSPADVPYQSMAPHFGFNPGMFSVFEQYQPTPPKRQWSRFARPATFAKVFGYDRGRRPERRWGSANSRVSMVSPVPFDSDFNRCLRNRSAQIYLRPALQVLQDKARVSSLSSSGATMAATSAIHGWFRGAQSAGAAALGIDLRRAPKLAPSPLDCVWSAVPT